MCQMERLYRLTDKNNFSTTEKYFNLKIIFILCFNTMFNNITNLEKNYMFTFRKEGQFHFSKGRSISLFERKVLPTFVKYISALVWRIL